MHAHEGRCASRGPGRARSRCVPALRVRREGDGGNARSASAGPRWRRNGPRRAGCVRPVGARRLLRACACRAFRAFRGSLANGVGHDDPPCRANPSDVAGAREDSKRFRRRGCWLDAGARFSRARPMPRRFRACFRSQECGGEHERGRHDLHRSEFSPRNTAAVIIATSGSDVAITPASAVGRRRRPMVKKSAKGTSVEKNPSSTNMPRVPPGSATRG